MAAKKRARTHHAVTGEPENDAGAVVCLSHPERCRKKQRRARVDERVSQAGASRTTVRIRPIGESGHRSTESAEDADGDCDVSPGGQILAARRDLQGVEHDCQGPAADRNVGQHGADARATCR